MKTAVAVAEENALTFRVWRTAALLGMIAALVGLSTRTHGAAPSGVSHRLAAYFVIAALEWAMVAWIVAGCRIQGESVYSLLGDFSIRWRTILRDCGLAVGFLVVANVLLGLCAALSRPHRQRRSEFFYPIPRWKTLHISA